MFGKRYLFYELDTGYVLLNEGRNNESIMPSIDRIIEIYPVLSERNRDTFDVLELDFGTYSQDFAECNGYRVNVETKALEFSYPDPNEPTVEQPYQAPLSEQVKNLEATILEMTAYSAAQDERLVMQEQALLELTTTIAGGNA